MPSAPAIVIVFIRRRSTVPIDRNRFHPSVIAFHWRNGWCNPCISTSKIILRILAALWRISFLIIRLVIEEINADLFNTLLPSLLSFLLTIWSMSSPVWLLGKWFFGEALAQLFFNIPFSCVNVSDWSTSNFRFLLLFSTRFLVNFLSRACDSTFELFFQCGADRASTMVPSLSS